MKKGILFLAAVLTLVNAYAQTTTTNSTAVSPISTQAASGSNSFTTATGANYSADQLATELQNLRGAVDRALPVISAFNQTYSNSVNGNQSLAGRLTGLLSGALNRGASSTNSNSSTTSELTNALARLQQLLNKNPSSTAPVSTDTLRELLSLQTELQPVAATLQNLNVTGTGSSTNAFGSQALTPTGR